MDRWKRSAATLGVVAAASLGALLIQAHARHGREAEPAWSAAFATDETAIPDDAVLLQELEKAVDLRRREDFDRMLDARDPGELIEHATLTEKALDRRILGIDALFVVGDELFGYLFRPENGWGSGGARKCKAIRASRPSAATTRTSSEPAKPLGGVASISPRPGRHLTC